MDSLAKLRNAMETVSPAVAQVGAWILRHPTQAATLGIEEIAKQSGASTASVNRFAKAAGYAGFIELKSALLQNLRNAVDPINKLRAEQSKKSVTSLASQVAVAKTNLDQVLSDNTASALADACDLLQSAERIFVLGLGLTTHTAGWFADALTVYFPTVLNIGGPGGTERSAARLVHVTKKDVFVVITLPRYSAASVSLASYATSRGAKVLAITDSLAAPVLSHADKWLLANASHSVLSSTYIATQLLCEAVVTEAARRNPKAVEMAANLTDAVISHLTFNLNPATPRSR
jgi:DNA-binding MurR/RpiR family transcriptional regulator